MMIGDEFFMKGLRINPTVGRFVVGGLLVLAATAMAVSWLDKLDRQSVAIGVAGLLGVSLAAALLVRWIPTAGSQVQRTTFSWSIMLLFIGYVGALFLSALTGDFPRPFPCLVQPWKDCPKLLAEDARRATEGQKTANPASPTGAPSRSAYTVSLMFVGSWNRDRDMKPLTAALHKVGWSFPEWEKGGYRPTDRPVPVGLAEVRFGDPADREAADLLAAEVQGNIALSRRVRAVPASAVKPRTLEIWLSN